MRRAPKANRTSGPLTAIGRVVKPGRRVAFAEGEVLDAHGKTVATAAVLRLARRHGDRCVGLKPIATGWTPVAGIARLAVERIRERGQGGLAVARTDGGQVAVAVEGGEVAVVDPEA